MKPFPVTAPAGKSALSRACQRDPSEYATHVSMIELFHPSCN
jgi:hypothetical protein